MSTRETIQLNHTELKYLLMDALKEYTEDSVYISGNNPYIFSVNKKVFNIFIRNVHESGQNRDNQDECRIQVGKSDNFSAALSSGKPVFFLGYLKDSNVFTAWNPYLAKERINKKATVSFYSRFSVQNRAKEHGISCYKDSNEQVVISFQPEYLGLYIENYDSMHHSDEATLLKLIEESRSVGASEEGAFNNVRIKETEFVVSHTRFKRDSRFRGLVADSYGTRCAFCDMDLELIEAAHIIPHSHPSGTDDPTNGLCLCCLHHAAYDSGLIYIDEAYNVKINKARVSYLEKTRRDGGITKFAGLHNETLKLPKSHIYYPSKEFIKIANQLRGVPDER